MILVEESTTKYLLTVRVIQNSCERVFNPTLNGQPIIVLSNNDGCAIARSDEAKALSIKMGAPWFKIRHLELEAGLKAYSANFELYGDMSHRMMTLAETLGCGQEVYSIDECFLDMTGIRDATERSRRKQAEILQCIGIPTCIGIAHTKTQAKLASRSSCDVFVGNRTHFLYKTHCLRRQAVRFILRQSPVGFTIHACP